VYMCIIKPCHIAVESFSTMDTSVPRDPDNYLPDMLLTLQVPVGLFCFLKLEHSVNHRLYLVDRNQAVHIIELPSRSGEDPAEDGGSADDAPYDGREIRIAAAAGDSSDEVDVAGHTDASD
jgi:hypothetical protein